MKSNGLTLLLTAALGAILAFSPSASAQDVSQIVPAHKMKMQPGIRYTTGSVTYSGWEKSLTDGDPNLKRWNWSAMTTYTQSCYNKVPAGAFLKQNKPEQMKQLKTPGSIYVKPVHVETVVPKTKPQGVIWVGTGTNSTGNVSGRVRLPKQNIASVAPVARSYNVNYVSGNMRIPDGEELATRSVHGRLLPN